MCCEEIRRHFIDFVYPEGDASPVDPEIREHVRTCAACRRELEELKQTRKYLQLWKEEDPLHHLAIAGTGFHPPRYSGRHYARCAAIAAMVLLCFLALANMQVRWDNSGFSFSTRLLGGNGSAPDYYTKSEVRDILKRALDDSELRMNETSYLMMQKMLDAVEQDRWMDLRLVRNRARSMDNRN